MQGSVIRHHILNHILQGRHAEDRETEVKYGKTIFMHDLFHRNNLKNVLLKGKKTWMKFSFFSVSSKMPWIILMNLLLMI